MKTISVYIEKDRERDRKQDRETEREKFKAFTVTLKNSQNYWSKSTQERNMKGKGNSAYVCVRVCVLLISMPFSWTA